MNILLSLLSVLFSSLIVWPSRSDGFHNLSLRPTCCHSQRGASAYLSSSTALGVTRGDTRGATLLLTDLNISTGSGNLILRDINFRVEPKERWGIVGKRFSTD